MEHIISFNNYQFYKEFVFKKTGRKYIPGINTYYYNVNNANYILNLINNVIIIDSEDGLSQESYVISGDFSMLLAPFSINGIIIRYLNDYVRVGLIEAYYIKENMVDFSIGGFFTPNNNTIKNLVPSFEMCSWAESTYIEKSSLPDELFLAKDYINASLTALER